MLVTGWGFNSLMVRRPRAGRRLAACCIRRSRCRYRGRPHCSSSQAHLTSCPTKQENLTAAMRRCRPAARSCLRTAGAARTRWRTCYRARARHRSWWAAVRPPFLWDVLLCATSSAATLRAPCRCATCRRTRSTARSWRQQWTSARSGALRAARAAHAARAARRAAVKPSSPSPISTHTRVYTGAPSCCATTPGWTPTATTPTAWAPWTAPPCCASTH